MAGEALLFTQFAAAALMVLLAGWLLWLDARSRVVRVFAAFLLVRAALAAGPGLAALDPATSIAQSRLVPAYQTLAVATLAYFLALYPHASRRRQRVAFASICAGALLVEIAYFWSPCLVECRAPGGQSVAGPLALVGFGFPAVAGAGALLLARAAMRAGSAHERLSTLLIAAGLAGDAILSGAVILGGAAGDPRGIFGAFVRNGWWWLAFALPLAGLALAALAPWSLARRRAGSAAARFGALAAMLGVAGALLGFSMVRGRSTGALETLVALRLILPLLVGYALLRYRLFEIDMRARWTLSRASLGAIFAAVFFLVSESVAALVGERQGLLVGLSAAALLLLALHPLQRTAERLIDATLGEPRPLGHQERIEFYRDLAARAWSDGALERRERIFLDELRIRLGLRAEEASVIESEIARGGTGR